MRFHSRCHGNNITLSEDRTVATRTNGFNHGTAYGDAPVVALQRITLEFKTLSKTWSGAVRYGFTNHDPSTINPANLPDYVIPNLTSKAGNWAKVLHERNAKPGFKLTYYYTDKGQVLSFINNEHFDTAVVKDGSVDVNKRMWMLLDVYGCSECVRLVTDSSDAPPAEILARGPQAMLAFKQAANSGTKPVFRTRLMLVGQDRVGKTSLKKSLTGQRYSQNERSTDGIDTEATCFISVNDAETWNVHSKHGTDTTTGEHSLGVIDGSSSACIEEEYVQAIASNISQELLNRLNTSSSPQVGSKDTEEEILNTSSPSPQEGAKTEAERLNTSLSQDGIKHMEDERLITSSSLDTSKYSGEESKELEDSNKTAISDDQEISDEAEVTKDDESEKECDDVNSLEQFTESLDKNLSERVIKLVEEILAKAKSDEETKTEDEKDGVAVPDIQLSIWDFAGQAVYYTTHQVFLSSRAIYIIVFDLSHDLDATARTQVTGKDGHQVEVVESELSNLDFMDFWMRSIHAHTAENTRKSPDNMTLSPPIFIVGTHRNSLSDDPTVQKKLTDDKFKKIRNTLIGKPYHGQVVQTYYAVENNLEDEDDSQIVKLRKHIQEVSSREPYMGEHIPLKWLRFETIVTEATERETNYLSLDKVKDIASELGIVSEIDLQIMLQFYHDLGVIIYYGTNGAVDESLRNTVILNPQWLIDVFRRIITVRDRDEQWARFGASWDHLDEQGILDEQLIDHMWRDIMDQKSALIGLMEKFDLLCQRIPPKKSKTVQSPPPTTTRSYYVPCRLKHCNPSREDLMSVDKVNKSCHFYITFGGFLPDGLFHRILTRAVRWTQEQGGREPKLYYRQARFYVDENHDCVLEMAANRYARLKITVLRMGVYDVEGATDSQTDTPNPNAVAKVRNFLDSTLTDLRKMWMKRIQCQFSVACICGRRCKLHQVEGCKQEFCLHFLSLDECLTEKIVMCEHRRVRTNVWRKWFPVETPPAVPLPITLPAPNKKLPEEEIPPWVKCAAKLLNSGCDGADWVSLANKLGYKKKKVQVFMDEMNPALELILDWIQSSGNTALSVEMMVSYLEQMLRDDVVDVIQKGQESDIDPPTVFISYNWGIQDDVRLLRDYLERAGFPCWMDIGQMGAGDALYSKIYEGIKNAKVVISCISPAYITSECCNREVNLADLLKKPIIPVLFNSMSWPPMGGMALIMSTLVYVDMHGIGGHGGSGRHSDIKRKYQDIIAQLKQHIDPITPKLVLQGNKPSKAPTDSVSTAPSSASRSHNSNPGSTRQDSGETGDEVGAAPQAAVTKCAVCIML